MEEDKEDIIDGRTGEIIPRGAEQIKTSNLQVQVNANTIGTLELSDETIKILDEELNPSDVKIRPDGLVYLPWTYWNDVLNKAFGRLKWGLIPQGSPQSKETGNNEVLVVWGFWLVIQGVPVSFSMGETSYRTNNKTMSYADAVEGAKSIALARNCKQLGMANQLWDASWVENWKTTNAKRIKNPKGNYPEYIWVKKDEKVEAPKKVEETPPTGQPPVDEKFPITAEEISDPIPYKLLKEKENVDAIKAGSQKSVPEIMAYLKTLDTKGDYKLSEIIQKLGAQDE